MEKLTVASVWERVIYNEDASAFGQKLLPLWERFYGPIQKVGGACIFGLAESRPEKVLAEPASVLVIAYPATEQFHLEQFDAFGFGFDAYISPEDLQHPDRFANSEDRILTRRAEGKKLFGEMYLEQKVGLIKISKSSATVGAIGDLSEACARKWALKTWEFFCKWYESEPGAYASDIHAFTRDEALRLGCKHGMFKLGGYG